MATIAPVSDLCNYEIVLDQVEPIELVYLTRSGHDAYCIRAMEDGKYFPKAEAMIGLLSEINAGIRFGEKEGWFSADGIADRYIKFARVLFAASYCIQVLFSGIQEKQ